MQYLASTKESFRELSVSVGNVLRDAWRDNKRQLLIVLSLSMLLAAMPYIERGIQALLLNHLVQIAKTRYFDSLLIMLLGASACALFFREAVRSGVSYVRRVYWFERRSRYELEYGEKLASLDTATHEDPKFRDKVQVLQEYGSSMAVASFFDSVIDNGENIVGFGSAFLIVLFADWRLAVLILLAAAPQLYVELRYGKGIQSAYENNSASRRLYQEMRRHTQTPGGVREMQTFQSVPYFLKRMKESLGTFISAQVAEDKKKVGLQIVCELILAIALVIALVVLVTRVLSGALEIGTFVFVFGAVISLDGAASSFLTNLAHQRREARTVSSYYDIMALEPVIKSPILGATLSSERAPRIEFRNVTFAYPGRPEEEVLKNFSLTIESGERLALVGVNGAGKSTLVKLLCRFYDPTEGAILLDGIDLREITLESWYEHLALLAQDFETYQIHVSELISLGRMSDNVSIADITRAAHRSESASFIERWPNRYDQQIGVMFAGGIDPSGGQKQKLALARALYRDALVSVLDEPTAHVDAGAEQEIFERLESELRPEQTLILISHRFSTVRNANRICVIKDGTVHELGSHAELIALDGTYAELFQKQAEGYR
ncbi:MAG: ABC transporter ATP-binding protein [Patescibacteria group bacterium]